jgi:hypothetical protein
VNALEWLRLPWMTWSQRTRRILALAAVVGAGSMAVGYAMERTPDVANLRLTHALALIDAILWAFVLSRTMLLAHEARRMRLPMLERMAAASMVLYAVLTIALPAWGLMLMGSPGSVALTELALGTGFGMGYATLPYWLGGWACLLPLLDNHANAWLPMPGANPTGFLHWATPLACVLWLSVMLFWRWGVRLDDDAARWARPAVLRWHALSVAGRNGAKLEAELLRRRAGWLRPGIDLSHTGPARPAYSLRLALGGWSAPQTTVSRLRQAALVLLNLSILLVAMLAFQIGSHDEAHAVAYAIVWSIFTNASLVAFGFSVFGAVLGPVRAEALRARWSRDNAEMPLLALLPGLGGNAKRALLSASLLPTLAAQAALLVGALGLACWAHLPAGNGVLLLLAQGGGMLVTVTLSIAALGGTALQRVWQSVLTIAATVLILTTTALALLTPNNGVALAQHSDASLAFAGLWAALLLVLLAIGKRGWHAYWQQPHPFLMHR